MTRKQFLRFAAGFGATVALACTADDDSSGDDSSLGSTGGQGDGQTDSGDSADDDDGADATEGGGSSGGADSGGGESDGGSSGAGSTDDGGTTGAVDCSADPAVVIGSNHGHTLVVPAADITEGTEQVYDITGDSSHPHSITLAPGDFQLLATTGEVTVQSTASGHTHSVTVTCG